MIVTCESCKSRYKIDDSKISGRGARITCPRCKHQFVVYTAEKNAGPSVMDAPKSADWDDEPTRVGARKEEASTPAPEPQPRKEAQEEPSGFSYEVAAPRQVQKVSAADASARAPTLDFRKVGINAWKVKVKIGLIYDFSDLKTLRKYIQDGRVTPADLISFDGKAWKAIGEIPDLDIFFVETYDQLFAEMASRPPEEPKPESSRPETRVESPSLPDGLSMDELQESKRTRPRPNGSAKSGKSSTPSTAAKEETNNRNMMILIAVVVVLALIGGYWWMNQGTPETPAATPGQATPAGAGTQEDREKLRKEIEGKMQPTDLPPPPPVNPPADDQKLVPVVPKNPPPTTPGTAPTGPAGGVTQGASTASDFVEAGDSAARSSNWSAAVAAYGQAAKKDPRNASIKAKLGIAQYQAKDPNALTTLEEAAKLGAKGDVYKVLGNLYLANGDTAGARDYFQKYLAGKPADAAAIEKKLKDMNGG